MQYPDSILLSGRFMQELIRHGNRLADLSIIRTQVEVIEPEFSEFLFCATAVKDLWPSGPLNLDIVSPR